MMSASDVSLTFYCVKVDAVWFDFASFGLLVLTGGAAVSYIGYDEARFFILCTVLSERQDEYTELGPLSRIRSLLCAV